VELDAAAGCLEPAAAAGGEYRWLGDLLKTEDVGVVAAQRVLAAGRCCELDVVDGDDHSASVLTCWWR
jgi:hypothetical protein